MDRHELCNGSEEPHVALPEASENPMTATCPISTERVDNNAARVSGGLVFVTVGLALATWAPWLLLVLAVDFLIKALGRPRYSPSCLLARWGLRRLGVKPAPTDAAPKVFAARMGTVMSFLTAALMLADAPLAARVCALMLMGCAFLEGAFGYCLGCQIYTLLTRLSPRPPTTFIARAPTRGQPEEAQAQASRVTSI
jgi:hypothetical protein